MNLDWWQELMNERELARKRRTEQVTVAVGSGSGGTGVCKDGGEVGERGKGMDGVEAGR